MTNLSWSLGFDREGWPTLRGPRAIVWQLWPVTWWQFERFVSDNSGLSNADYEQILSRASVKRPASGSVTEQTVQIRGLTSANAHEFVRWQNNGWRIPTDQEWRDLVESVSHIQCGDYLHELAGMAVTSGKLVLPSSVRVRLVVGFRASDSLDELMLLGRHAYEWVTFGSRDALRGGNQSGSGVLSFIGDRFPIEPLNTMDSTILPFCGLRLVRSESA